MLLYCWELLGSPLLSSKQYEIYNAKFENMHKNLNWMGLSSKQYEIYNAKFENGHKNLNWMGKYRIITIKPYQILTC